MTINAYFQKPKVVRRLRERPLGEHIDRYAARLTEEGHCHQSGARCIRIVGHFNQWLVINNIVIDDIDESVTEQYLRYRAHFLQPFFSDSPALYRLLKVLREIGVIAPSTPVLVDPLKQIEQDFGLYLSQERGLEPVTITRHLPPLRKFLHEYCPMVHVSFAKLKGVDIIRFIEHHAHDQSP